MNERMLHQLVGSIYAAVSQPAIWTSVLEAISDAHRGASILLGRQSFVSGAQSLMTCRMESAIVERYAQDFSRPERLEFIRHLPDVALAEAITPEAFQGEDAFLASPLYAEVFRPFGLRYLVTSILYREPEWAYFFALVRPMEAGPFGEDELERIGWLSKHLGCAMALQNSLGAAEAKNRILAQVVDRFQRGAVIVEADGRIRFANRAARAVLDRGDGLVAFGGRLHARTGAETSRLFALVADATSTDIGQDIDSGHPLRISRQGSDGDYKLVISPLMLPEPASDEDRGLALVLIAEPERVLPPVEHLTELHGLTPAEARVLLRLMAGDSRAQAAEALGVSLNTIRFHLRNLMAKTGAKRQAELIQQLSGGA